jgi:hypothetical protein
MRYKQTKEINGKRYEIVEQLGGLEVEGDWVYFDLVATKTGERLVANHGYPQNEWSFCGTMEDFDKLQKGG